MEPGTSIQRLVISGARFTDDSAADAVRGLHHSGVLLLDAIDSLFPESSFLVFMEDGHPADIPDDAEEIEAYEGYRAGGQISVGLVRWSCVVKGRDALERLLGTAESVTNVIGLMALKEDEASERVRTLAYELVAMSNLDSPPARYNPVVLPDLVAEVQAAILLHLDKHGSVLGVYSEEKVEAETVLKGLCDKCDGLLVPFAIPPMLARWDRALSELKAIWPDEIAFPVPEAAEQTWIPRNARRGRDTDLDSVLVVEE
jgi:hypothetical protein